MPPSVTSVPAPTSYHLFRGVLSDADALIPITAAAPQATRLAACSRDSFVFASGQKVYNLQCSPTRKRSRSESPENSTHPDHKLPSAVSSAIADDYIVPRPFSSVTITPYAVHSTHCSEVQSVAADDTRVASVDGYGRCIITVDAPYQPTNPDLTNANSTNPDSTNAKPDKAHSSPEAKSFVLSPISLTTGDPGWAGVALRRNHLSTALVARQFFRDVTVFDSDVPIRTIYTILPPHAAAFCGDGNTIAVAEGRDLSFFDTRAGENRGCVARKTIGNGSLLSMDVSDNGEIVATAGMDRVLSVFDTRTMTARDRWSACLKYECAGTVLSRSMEGMAYVCSVDNEVACGAWSSDMADCLKAQGNSKSLMISGANTKSPRRAFGFRADVRLTGIARTTTPSEEIAVMSESGAFYLLRRKPD